MGAGRWWLHAARLLSTSSFLTVSAANGRRCRRSRCVGTAANPASVLPRGVGGVERGRCQARAAAACRGCVAAVLGLCKHRSPGAVCSQGGRARAAICWRSRSAAGPGRTPALLELGPAPQPSAGTAAATALLWGLSVPCGFAPSRILLRPPRVLGTPRVQPFSACSSWRQSPSPSPHIWTDGQPDGHPWDRAGGGRGALGSLLPRPRASGSISKALLGCSLT